MNRDKIINFVVILLLCSLSFSLGYSYSTSNSYDQGFKDGMKGAFDVGYQIGYEDAIENADQFPINVSMYEQNHDNWSSIDLTYMMIYFDNDKDFTITEDCNNWNSTIYQYEITCSIVLHPDSNTFVYVELLHDNASIVNESPIHQFHHVLEYQDNSTEVRTSVEYFYQGEIL